MSYNQEIEDKKTGEKKVVPRQIRMSHFSDQNLDMVAQASQCKNYAHNRFFVYKVLNNYRVLPNWEWKKNKEK